MGEGGGKKEQNVGKRDGRGRRVNIINKSLDICVHAVPLDRTDSWPQ